MNFEQLLSWARAIITEDGGCKVSAATPVGRPHSDAEVPSSIRRSGTVIYYKCSGPNHMTRNCTAGGVRHPEGSDGARRFGRKQQCFRCDKIGHISSECQGNVEEGRQRQPSFWANEKPAVACCKSAHRRESTALVDTGCSQTLVSKAVCRRWRQKEVGVLNTVGRTPLFLSLSLPFFSHFSSITIKHLQMNQISGLNNP